LAKGADDRIAKSEATSRILTKENNKQNRLNTIFDDFGKLRGQASIAVAALWAITRTRRPPRVNHEVISEGKDLTSNGQSKTGGSCWQGETSGVC
jgi:hypothetical protein